MASRLLLAVIVVVTAISSAATASSQPPVSSGVYTVRADPRLCPSPLCGGYWVALANGARTRCVDGTRSAQCYVAEAVDELRRPLAVSISDGGLARGAIEPSDFGGLGKLGVLVVAAVFTPAGEAAVSGGYYRVVDTAVRCVRTPCFSYRATQLNGSTRTMMSDVDLGAARATPAEVERARVALRTKSGLFARGRFARTADGGRVFRALRFFLREPQPRA